MIVLIVIGESEGRCVDWVGLGFWYSHHVADTVSVCSNGSRGSTSGGESHTTTHTEFGSKSRGKEYILDLVVRGTDRFTTGHRKAGHVSLQCWKKHTRVQLRRSRLCRTSSFCYQSSLASYQQCYSGTVMSVQSSFIIRYSDYRSLCFAL